MQISEFHTQPLNVPSAVQTPQSQKNKPKAKLEVKTHEE